MQKLQLHGVRLDAPLHKFTSNKSRSVVTATLLTAQENEIQQPILSWIISLRKKIHALPCNYLTYANAADIAAILTAAVQIFIAMEQFQLAKEICYSQIQMFIKFVKSKGYNDTIQYIYLPWLNLVRLDRKLFHYASATKKLNLLFTTASRVMSDEIKNVAVAEFVTLQLLQKNYTGLIHFQATQKKLAYSQQQILYEGKVLALIQKQEYQAALDYLQQLESLLDNTSLHIFKLRQCELQQAGLYDYQVMHDLYCDAQKRLQSLQANQHDGRFILHLIELLDAYNMQTLANDLTHKMLLLGETLQDEWIIAETLIRLYKSASKDEKKFYENRLITHYSQTQYLSLRYKMLATCSDLKYVEKFNCQFEALGLFEELINLCQ